jgi:cytochrome c556
MLTRFQWVLALALGLMLMGISAALGFSFDFGDDDDDWWRYAYRGNPNQAWIAPNGMMFYPRLPYYERNRMLDRRQWQMGQKYRAMDELGAMLYGNAGFDRASAIKLARKIEALSGPTLTQNFHPGSIATDRSRSLLSLWHNRSAFEANAEALRVAAKELAHVLEIRPGEGEATVMLPSASSESRGSAKSVAVAPAVWDKFNSLSMVCDSCHSGFRGHRW